MAVTLAITDRKNDSSDASTYTFTSTAIGSADATRTVLIAVIVRGTTPPSITSVTIGGNSMGAALISTLAPPGTVAAGSRTAIYALAVAAGTTATVVVTLTAGMQRCSIIAASLTGDYNVTPYATSHDEDSDTVGDLNQTPDINVLNGGAVFGVAQGGTVTTLTLTWTGLTNDTQQTNEALRIMAGTLAVTGDETPRSLTINYDTGPADTLFAPCCVVVSYQPTAAATAPRRTLLGAGV